MKTVTVSRNALLQKLQANRETHRALFLAAQRGYRHEVIKALDKSLEDARNGVAYRTYVALLEPQDHSEDYDTVIAMLEMSIEPEIVVEQREFQQYVLDKWDWAAQAKFVNSTYAEGGTLGPGDVMGHRPR